MNTITPTHLLSRRLLAALCVSACFAWSPVVLRALTIVWGNTATAFGTNANWSGGQAPANDLTTDIGSFQAATVSFNPQLTASRSINGLDFALGTGAWTFSGSSGTRTLTLGASGIVSNAASTQTFNQGNLGIALGANAAFTSNSTGALFFGSTLASFNLSTFTLTLNGSSSNTSNAIGAVVSGTGSIIKSGTGTWIFSGANTYTGTTTISQGTLQLNANAPSGAAGTLGNAASTVTLNDASTGANNNALLIGTSGVTVARTVTVANSGTGTTTLGSNITSGTGTFTGNVTLNKAASLEADGTANITFSTGVISGTGNITKIGTGTVTLSGTNTYTGATTINAGTLKAGVASVANTSGAFGNNSAVTLANTAGATLDITGFNTQIGSLTGGGATGGNVTLGAATLTVGGDNTSPGAFAGVISGTGGSLAKTGTGTLTFSGANTYTGTTTISQGTLQLNANAPSGSAGTLGNAASTVTLNDASTGANNTALLIGTSGVSVARNITVANSGTGTTTLGSNITSGTGTFTGNVTLNKAASLEADGTANITFSTGVISGTGNITKIGTGTVTLSGTNTYTGATTINAGTLKAGVASVANTSGAFGNNSAVTLANTAGATLDITGFNTQIGSLTGGGATGGNVTLGTATLTVGGDNTSPGAFAGVISGTGGSLTKTGTGTLTFSGANTYTGTTTISAGTLDLAFNQTFSTVSLAGGTLALDSASNTITTLSLAANSTIDFSSSVNATLNVTNLNLNGFTLNITNWTAAVDHFYATNWIGATHDVMGSAPMNLVTFNGFTASQTGWDSYDNQIRPNVPEPATYGAWLIGTLMTFSAWRRRRA